MCENGINELKKMLALTKEKYERYQQLNIDPKLTKELRKKYILLQHIMNELTDGENASK